MKYRFLTIVAASAFIFASCGATDGDLDGKGMNTDINGRTETGQTMGSEDGSTTSQEGQNQSESTISEGVINENDIIRVNSPEPGALVGNELTVSGMAKAWYFEGSFPISVLDEKRDILYEGSATAIGDWMTTDFVPFKESITLTKKPSTAKGMIIFKKSNPSGLPEFEASFEIPVRFE